MSPDPIALRERLIAQFDLEELRTLSMDLGVDFDSLRGEGKAAKARELVLYMQRRGWLDRLAAAIQAARGPALGDQRPTPGGQTVIHTGGGAYVAGDVNVEGGDFVGRDQRNVDPDAADPKKEA